MPLLVLVVKLDVVNPRGGTTFARIQKIIKDLNNTKRVTRKLAILGEWNGVKTDSLLGLYKENESVFKNIIMK